jgi:hypothetical protein
MAFTLLIELVFVPVDLIAGLMVHHVNSDSSKRVTGDIVCHTAAGIPNQFQQLTGCILQSQIVDGLLGSSPC